MGLKCEKCGNAIYTGYFYKWSQLFSFIYFMRLEDYITDGTYEEMTNNLLSLKGIVMDADDELEARKKKNEEELDKS